MLIKIESITGVEYINPDQITVVSLLRNTVLINFTSQATVPVSFEEWTRVEPLLVRRLPAAARSPIDFSRSDIRAILSVPLGVTADEALAAVKELTRGDVQLVKNWNGRIEFAISSIPLDEWLPDDEQPDDSDPDSEEI